MTSTNTPRIVANGRGIPADAVEAGILPSSSIDQMLMMAMEMAGPP